MYDWSTGQVFREWIVDHRLLVRAGGDEPDWSRRRPCPLVTPRGSRGPRSLVDMAASVVGNNIALVPGDYLGALAVHLRRRIWRVLEARGVCLHAWKLFSKQLLRNDDEPTLGLYRFRQHICSPADELKSYTQPLTSLATDFITHLVIGGGCGFATSELLCLTDVKNLGVLELIQPFGEGHAAFPQVGDRLIRGWTETNDPFPLLRILRIWVHPSVTQESLRMVSKFPCLVFYDVVGSQVDWASPKRHAAAEGWETSIAAPSDFLWHDLMLFAPLGEPGSHWPRDVARSMDRFLVSIFNDSRRAFGVHAKCEAPSLLDRLTEKAKDNTPRCITDVPATSSDSRSCHGEAFEPWAFWLYSLIGQLTRDGDLTSRGVEIDVVAVVEALILPSKPFASLSLGHSGRGAISTRPSYVERGPVPTRRHTFVRSSLVRPWTEAEPKAPRRARTDEAAPSRRGGLSLRRQKRQRLDHVLRSFTS